MQQVPVYKIFGISKDFMTSLLLRRLGVQIFDKYFIMNKSESYGVANSSS